MAALFWRVTSFPVSPLSGLVSEKYSRTIIPLPSGVQRADSITKDASLYVWVVIMWEFGMYIRGEV